jgi:hypothetical protein
MAAAGRIKALDYSLAVIKMMVSRRTFIALTVDDLTALMDQGDPWVSVGINALRDYLIDPGLRFDTAVNVVVKFLGRLYARGNCEFGVVLELIEYLFEALMRHKDCPRDWETGCTMLLFAEFAPTGLGLQEHRFIAEFVQRAVERTKHPMKPVTVKAKVLHIAEMPRFVSGDIQDADEVAQEQVAEEKRVAEPYETSATGPTEGQEQPPIAI